MTHNTFKLIPDGALWAVRIRTTHDDSDPGDDWRKRQQKTRTHWGNTLHTGTWDECQKWIKDNQNLLK
jgi:hypothetical protein